VLVGRLPHHALAAAGIAHGGDVAEVDVLAEATEDGLERSATGGQLPPQVQVLVEPS